MKFKNRQYLRRTWTQLLALNKHFKYIMVMATCVRKGTHFWDVSLLVFFSLDLQCDQGWPKLLILLLLNPQVLWWARLVYTLQDVEPRVIEGFLTHLVPHWPKGHPVTKGSTVTNSWGCRSGSPSLVISSGKHNNLSLQCFAFLKSLSMFLYPILNVIRGHFPGNKITKLTQNWSKLLD